MLRRWKNRFFNRDNDINPTNMQCSTIDCGREKGDH